MISADPVAWYRPEAHLMGEENYAELIEAINDSETVRAMLEDYRAGLSVDRDADRADRLAGRTIGCPTLVLWSSRGDIEVLFDDPLALWKAWTDDLRGTCVESGAQIPEDNPDELVTALTEFLGDAPQEGGPSRASGVAAERLCAFGPGRRIRNPSKGGNCRRPVQISAFSQDFAASLLSVLIRGADRN